ncbi:MAG: type II toxin-antitoxin system PemK/MazF family toxin [Bryobacteraceae bacterium]|jgi:mRNA interferase MazF
MIRRGQVHFASLDPVRGREQAGNRLVLVVSSDAINRLPLVVTVVVGTDAANISCDYPVNVRVTAAESGLPRDTVFLCFQVRALDRSRLVTPEVGALPALRMAEVDTALRRALDL